MVNGGNMDIESLMKNLESKADPKQAEIVRKYMKSQLKFYGLKIPMIRKLVADFIKYERDITLIKLYPKLQKLWKSHVFELMAAALFILEKLEKEFDESTWELLDRWIDDLDNWALCDWMCTLRVKMVDHDKERKLTLLMEWTQSSNMWRRRSAIISTLKLKRFNTALKLKDVEPLIISLLEDEKRHDNRKEFFIQKAIGWLLRSYGDFEPDATLTFANAHRHQMSNLAYREATRKLLVSKK
jgi:3-methyladenine DNA glycosylase AlkD